MTKLGKLESYTLPKKLSDYFDIDTNTISVFPAEGCLEQLKGILESLGATRYVNFKSSFYTLTTQTPDTAIEALEKSNFVKTFSIALDGNKSKAGTKAFIDGRVHVRFKTKPTASELERFTNSHDLKLIQEKNHSDGLEYLFSVKSKNTFQAILTSEEVLKEKNVAASEVAYTSIGVRGPRTTR